MAEVLSTLGCLCSTVLFLFTLSWKHSDFITMTFLSKLGTRQYFISESRYKSSSPARLCKGKFDVILDCVSAKVGISDECTTTTTDSNFSLAYFHSSCFKLYFSVDISRSQIIQYRWPTAALILLTCSIHSKNRCG